jgi:hypothetical protein
MWPLLYYRDAQVGDSQKAKVLQTTSGAHSNEPNPPKTPPNSHVEFFGHSSSKYDDSSAAKWLRLKFSPKKKKKTVLQPHILMSLTQTKASSKKTPPNSSAAFFDHSDFKYAHSLLCCKRDSDPKKKGLPLQPPILMSLTQPKPPQLPPQFIL